MKAIRLLAVGVLAAAGLAVGIGAASAHIVVDPSASAKGTELVVLTFRVPNESARAGTVGVSITMPTKTPLATVRYKDVPGWTAKAVTTHLLTPVKEGNFEVTDPVTSVTFTADSGTKIEPGAFADFELQVGPVPDVAALSFPTDQSYDDGSVVRWVDPATAGGEESEHPSPTLTVAGTDAAAAPAVSASDGTARTLGVVGVILAALSLLVSAVGLSRRRHRQTPPAQTKPAGLSG
ncbi:MAG: YcnI family protein [Actinomycetota bacterium]|nr:YcnI family protein [Actinomycetota bacterium]